MNPAIPPPRVTDGGLRRQTTEVLSTGAVRARPLVGGLSVSCRGVALTRRRALLAAALGHFHYALEPKMTGSLGVARERVASAQTHQAHLLESLRQRVDVFGHGDAYVGILGESSAVPLEPNQVCQSDEQQFFLQIVVVPRAVQQREQVLVDQTERHVLVPEVGDVSDAGCSGQAPDRLVEAQRELRGLRQDWIEAVA